MQNLSLGTETVSSCAHSRPPGLPAPHLDSEAGVQEPHRAGAAAPEAGVPGLNLAWPRHPSSEPLTLRCGCQGSDWLEQRKQAAGKKDIT